MRNGERSGSRAPLAAAGGAGAPRNGVRVHRRRMAEVIGVLGLLFVGTVVFAFGAGDAQPVANVIEPVSDEPVPTGCEVPADVRREQRASGEPIRSGPSARPKRIALGFDDGPSMQTVEVLDILERHGARATFFVVGAEAAKRPAELREVVRRGHEVANHSFEHTNFKLAGAGAQRSELRATNAVIHRAAGFTPCVYRPPYGATNAELVRDALKLDLTTVTWNVDPSDWGGSRESIAQIILDDAEPGSIVVVHDGGRDRAETIAALPKILRKLERRGYELVTVSELLSFQPSF